MALKYLFNPLSGKFDLIYIPTPSGGSSVPLVIDTGTTFTVATNTQVVHANAIVTTGNGIGLTVGTGVITYVN